MAGTNDLRGGERGLTNVTSDPSVTSDPRGDGRTGVADAHGDRCK